MASLPDFSAGLVEVLDGDQTATLTTQDPAQLGLPSVVKRYALPIEWEQRKPLIRQLYLAENKPLREVIEILGKHGHYGSENQYKKRISKWNFDTKYERHQATRKRKVKHSKSPSSALNHSSITPADTQHSQLAIAGPSAIPTAASSDGVEGQHGPIGVPQFIQGNHTSGIQSGVPLTARLSPAEQVFSCARQHIETSFDYSCWKLDDSDTWISTQCTPDTLDLPEAYFDLIRSAVLLFSQQSAVEAGLVLSKAFALIRPILTSGNVRALNFFWASLAYLIQFDHPEIVTTLIKYIRDMTSEVLRGSHPVSRLFDLLVKVDIAELEMFVHHTWQVTADTFQSRLGQLHPEYVRHQCDLIFRIYGTKFPATAETKLKDLLQKCVDTPDAPKLSYLTVLNALGYNAMNSTNWAEAASLGKQLEDCARNAEGVDVLVYQFGGLEIQGRALIKMGLWELAVGCLAKATPMIAEEWGFQDPWRIELMALQQEWLRENNELQAADTLRAEIQSLAQQMKVD